MSDKIELNRRRVLGGLVTIGAAGAAVGAGTFAAFSDTVRSQNNSIEAGTLELGDINDKQLTVNNLVPEESTGNFEVTSTYTGSVAPTLDWGITVENDTTDGASTDFADVLEVTTATLEIEKEDSGYTEIETYDGTLSSLEEESTYTDVVNSESSTPLTSGDTVHLTLEFTLQDVGNDYQGASLDFGVALKARQDTGAPLADSEYSATSE